MLLLTISWTTSVMAERALSAFSKCLGTVGLSTGRKNSSCFMLRVLFSYTHYLTHNDMPKLDILFLMHPI